MRSEMKSSAPFGLKIAAAAGLLFLHLSILAAFYLTRDGDQIAGQGK